MGSLATLAAVTLSSNFCEMVDLIVFPAGISISSPVRLLVLLMATCVELAEDEEEVELVEDDEVEEQVLQSESESELSR